MEQRERESHATSLARAKTAPRASKSFAVFSSLTESVKTPAPFSLSLSLFALDSLFVVVVVVVSVTSANAAASG